MIGLLAAWATAAPLDIQVEVLPPPPRPAVAPQDRPWVPVARATHPPVVDGRHDEPVWARARPGPALRPLATGHLPPDWPVKVVWSSTGLFVATPPVPDGLEATILVHPQAHQSRWFEVVLGDPPQGCWPDEPGRPPVPPPGTPCRPLEGGVQAVSGPDGWELVFEADTLAATDQLRVLVQLVDAPKRTGGTWAPDRVGAADPRRALPLAFGKAPRPRLAVTTDLERNRWVADVTGVPEGTAWTWQVWSGGHPVREGTLAHEAGAASVVLEGSWPQATVELRQVEGPKDRPAVAVSRAVPRARAEAALATPLFAEELVVRFALSDPREARVEVRDAAGQVLGEGTAVLPRGEGLVHIRTDPSWDAVVLVVDGLITRPAQRGPR